MNGGTTSGMTGIGTAYVYRDLILAVLKGVILSVAAAERIRQSWRREKTHGEILSDLRTVLVAHNYTRGTSRKYAVCVMRFLGDVGGRRLDTLRDDDVVVYLENLSLQGLSNATVRLHLCAIRAVFDRILDLGITTDIKHVPRPAPRRRATVRQIEQIRGKCTAHRERLIFSLLHDHRLRPDQIRRLVVAEPSTTNTDGHSKGSDRNKKGDLPILLLPLGDSLVQSRHLLPGRNTSGGISSRTILRTVQRLGKSCGFSITCTAIRLAPADAVLPGAA